MKDRGITLKSALKKELRDPEFRKAFNDEDLPARLAVRIAKLREAQGLTQRALARKMGVTQQALSLLEKPSSARYTLRTLQRVASALNRELVVQLR
ncbi:MAG: helix-turn-helix transcriptional regulator [Candidatus Coatesbacteria bacterium]